MKLCRETGEEACGQTNLTQSSTVSGIDVTTGKGA